MADFKSLAKDTAIYGLSSIIGRFLNYLLVPVYTMSLPAQGGGYGVVTNIYAWVALVLVILTCGMETGSFRFANKEGMDPMRVYSTTLCGVGLFSLVFLLLGLTFLKPVSGVLGYGQHPWYVGMMMIVVAMDAFQSIVFAYLRFSKKALVFAGLKLAFIILNIALNLIYYVGMKGQDVGKAFLFNLICTSSVMLMMIPFLRRFNFCFDRKLFREMLSYCLPLLILGIAGILNQVADKIIFNYVYPDKTQGLVELGIYGAAVKIAMIMAMLTQAFRYAYEPIVFDKSKDSDSTVYYAKAMKYFIIFTLLAFLAVVFYMDILKYIIGRDYREGLKVVPIVMMAEIFMGIYFNLSFWYKLIDKTIWGAVFSIIGCVVLLAVNVIFIPRYSYMACAWAGLCGYGVAMVLSYFVGQRKFKVDYDLKSIGLYFLLFAVLYALSSWIQIENVIVRLLFRTVLLFVFIAYIIWKDLPLSKLPFIGRFFR